MSRSRNRGNILVIDDEVEVFLELKSSLKAQNVYHRKNLRGVREAIRGKKIDLAFIDLNLEGDLNPERLGGLEYISKFHQTFPTVTIVVLSQYRDVDGVVKAVNSGATDYKWKGALDPDTVKFREEINQLIRGKKERDRLKESTKIEIWGKSPQTQRLIYELDKIAKTQESIFLYGEPGVGKANVLSYLHNKSLHYTESRPVVRENLSHYSYRDILTILKGKPRKGSTNFIKKARNNILELSHISQTSLEVQKILLEVIRRRSYLAGGDSLIIQFIFLLDRSPAELLAKKKLHAELFYALSCIKVEPLRNRKDDLFNIIPKWLAKRGFAQQQFSEPFFAYFTGYDYPGNTEELYALLEEMMKRHQEKFSQNNSWKQQEIGWESIPKVLLEEGIQDELANMDRAVAKVELEYIERALQYFNGKKGKAAKALNIPSGADNLKKSYIRKYQELFPDLVQQFPMIMKCYKIN